MAAGAGLSSVAYLGAGQMESKPPKPSAEIRLYDLNYRRPLSPDGTDFKEIPDPFPGKLPSQALAELAHSCVIRAYTMDAMDKGSIAGGPMASMYILPANLTDESLNCLTNRLRPPYLNLRIAERCRAIVEKNSGAPPCHEPIP